jgi:glucose-6-phosphate-specific signal transduction histidine kinase
MIYQRSGNPAQEAWFREHPRLAGAVAVLLFAAVYVLRQAAEGADEAISVLNVLPIALVAFAFGRRAGLVAGTAGVGLFAISGATNDVPVTLAGWLARTIPMLLLGLLVGSAAEQQRTAATLRQRLLEAELRADRPLRSSPLRHREPALRVSAGTPEGST